MLRSSCCCFHCPDLKKVKEKVKRKEVSSHQVPDNLDFCLDWFFLLDKELRLLQADFHGIAIMFSWFWFLFPFCAYHFLVLFLLSDFDLMVHWNSVNFSFLFISNLSMAYHLPE